MAPYRLSMPVWCMSCGAKPQETIGRQEAAGEQKDESLFAPC